MIQLLQSEYDFPVLKQFIKEDLAKKEQSIEQMRFAVFETFPKLIHLTLDFNSSDIPKDPNLTFNSASESQMSVNIHRFLQMISEYLDTKRNIIYSRLISGEIKVSKENYKNLKKVLANTSDNISPGSIEELMSFSTLNIDDKVHQTLLHHGLKKLMLALVRDEGIHSLKKVFNCVSRANIIKSDTKPKIYSNFTQSQLGLLSTILSKTFNQKVGFTNLKKSVLDNLFFETVESQGGPIKNKKALSSRGYGGSESLDGDYQALISYFDLLKEKVKELQNN